MSKWEWYGSFHRRDYVRGYKWNWPFQQDGRWLRYIRDFTSIEHWKERLHTCQEVIRLTMWSDLERWKEWLHISEWGYPWSDLWDWNPRHAGYCKHSKILPTTLPHAIYGLRTGQLRYQMPNRAVWGKGRSSRSSRSNSSRRRIQMRAIIVFFFSFLLQLCSWYCLGLLSFRELVQLRAIKNISTLFPFLLLEAAIFCTACTVEINNVFPVYP